MRNQTNPSKKPLEKAKVKLERNSSEVDTKETDPNPIRFKEYGDRFVVPRLINDQYVNEKSFNGTPASLNLV